LEEIVDYIQNNINTFQEELKEFLRIPSISMLPEHKGDINRCAEYVADKLRNAGLSRVKIFKTEGHPLVYGEWLGAPGQPVVLIYGHYDVQPIDPIELWDTPPFEPVIKNGKIYARFMHFKSVESFFKVNGSLPLNVKFIIEGEEETGSQSMQSFINNNAELLKCDAVMISDTALFDEGIPTLTYGLRGLSYMEVEVSGPKADLHSGTYGGAIGNPINILAGMIAKLHDKNGRINIPQFYDDVLRITSKEKKNFGRLKFSEKKFAQEAGVRILEGEKGYSTLERIWARPTLDCNGIWGGFTGNGAKTVITTKATAKISMRLVPNQDPNKISRLFTKHIKRIAPKSVKVEVRNLNGAYPVLTPLDNPATIAAAKSMEKAFGKKIVFMREGGSVPIVTVFSKKLKVPVVLMGLGLNNENLHSPNEHFNLNHFRLGIISSVYFMKEFSL